ncbi:hypothetical protein RRG08_035724 [Elysia crispata]|uniref:Uncharacterized protein n=1 Tax=Elysia crispata TaxID=231223 RepID=A0AAE0YJ45_9GAST|nr:hypothetical protein RRG08_035724 [Elysia crispata]
MAIVGERLTGPSRAIGPSRLLAVLGETRREPEGVWDSRPVPQSADLPRNFWFACQTGSLKRFKLLVPTGNDEVSHPLVYGVQQCCFSPAQPQLVPTGNDELVPTGNDEVSHPLVYGVQQCWFSPAQPQLVPTGNDELVPTGNDEVSQPLVYGVQQCWFSPAQPQLVPTGNDEVSHPLVYGVHPAQPQLVPTGNDEVSHPLVYGVQQCCFSPAQPQLVPTGNDELVPTGNDEVSQPLVYGVQQCWFSPAQPQLVPTGNDEVSQPLVYGVQVTSLIASPQMSVVNGPYPALNLTDGASVVLCEHTRSDSGTAESLPAEKCGISSLLHR